MCLMATVPKATEQAQQKPSIFCEVTAYFDDLTWGDLKRFVELAERDGINPDTPVGMHYQDDDYREPNGISFTFAAGSRLDVVKSGDVPSQKSDGFR